MTKISIIIPVYNPQIEYLKECLNSAIQQKEDIEIILIDNASSKNCSLVLQEYKNSNSKIKLIRFSKNKGYSGACNAGIEISQGEYLLFLDSDDILAPQICKTIIQHLNKHPSEICFFPFNIIDAQTKKILSTYTPPSITESNGYIPAEKILNNDSFAYHQTWNKIYKSSWIKQKEIKFNEKLPNILVDKLFTFTCLSEASLISEIITEPLYYYRVNSKDGVCSQLSSKNCSYIKEFFIFAQSMYQLSKNKNLILKKRIISEVFISFLTLFKNIHKTQRKSFLLKTKKLLKKYDFSLLEQTKFRDSYILIRKKSWKKISLNFFKSYQFKIFGIPFYKKTISGSQIKKSFFWGIIKLTSSPQHTSIRIFKINIKHKKKNKTSSFNHKGIIAVKTAPLYVPYSLKIVTTIADLGVYKNIITVTCYDEMKYSPYSFFRDLVAAIFEYTVSQKLFSKNDFTMFSSIDTTGMIKDLITFKERDIDSPEDTRYTYFDIFLTLLQAIPNTLIFIENFDKIDTSSYDVLKYLFEAFEQLDISYLIQYDKEFSLHKDMHFLLSKPYYTEITLKPTPFEKMIAENKEYYKNIMDTFYFQRIAKYSFGSILFLDIAIQYLIESGVFEATEDTINLINPKTIIIPSSLNKLVKRRLNLLQDYPEAIKFLTKCVLLGTRIDQDTIKSLGCPELEETIEKLSQMGYIYFYNNCMYFPNYNILRENLLETLSKDNLKEIANFLFENIFEDSMPSPEKAYLYGLLDDHKSEFLEWEKLAKIDLSLGDFNAYLNCADRILKLLDMNTDEEAQDDIEKYKLELFENISNNLFDYIPEQTFPIAEQTLLNLEKAGEADKVVNLCNKMIQGCLLNGNYTHALELTHKILSMLPNASIDPGATDYNHYFFLMSLVHVEILFNIGAWEDCLDVGYRVLNVVNQANLSALKPDYLTEEQFEAIVMDTIAYVALCNVLQLKGNVQEFLNIVIGVCI